MGLGGKKNYGRQTKKGGKGVGGGKKCWQLLGHEIQPGRGKDGPQWNQVTARSGGKTEKKGGEREKTLKCCKYKGKVSGQRVSSTRKTLSFPQGGHNPGRGRGET